MTKHRLFKQSPKEVRDTLQRAVDVAETVHKAEQELVEILHKIDSERFYVRYGYKSLRGFCIHGLKFTRIQSQRLATVVRRKEPTVKIGLEGESE